MGRLKNIKKALLSERESLHQKNTFGENKKKLHLNIDEILLQLSFPKEFSHIKRIKKSSTRPASPKIIRVAVGNALN